ncbi:uncharacterized protein LOC135847736 isoform X1 [Planococcus citri]|uniref:uncharacterized protein LOC135847736 isoform X1 n=1 Tax=Planococcus citri TaxID=170843 RepID=UPI0031F9E880
MAEVPSDVHDIFHPSPVSLKDLAAIAVSFEVWRCENNIFREHYNPSDYETREVSPSELRCSEHFEPIKEWEKPISVKTLLPDLPSVLYKMIEEYLAIFKSSLSDWRENHNGVLFLCHHISDILILFDDFARDDYGEIDCLRTAKRLMCCDGFDAYDKFFIACAYFFEDEVRRLWSFILETEKVNVKLDNFEFVICPQVYYWVARLLNKSDKVPTDDAMLDSFIPHNAPSMLYFWNRIPSENRTRKAISLANRCTESVVRFILPKLDDQQLLEFVNEEGSDMMRTLWWRVSYHGEGLVLNVWSYIRDIMNERDFTNLVVEMLDAPHRRDEDKRMRCKYLAREIWNNARTDLKRSVIRNISSDILKRVGIGRIDYDEDGDRWSIIEVDVEFLLIVLAYSSFADRASFWTRFWHLLILDIPGEGLQRIMKLCFENEDDIGRFKQNTMTKSDAVRKLCILYLSEAKFDKLHEFANFCCPELQSARAFKQQLLRSDFLNEHCHFNARIVWKLDKFNEFINEAYNDEDSSTAFKNQFMSLPSNQLRLCKFYYDGEVDLDELIKFTDTIVSREQTVSEIKIRMLDLLKKKSVTCLERYTREEMSGWKWVNSILSWCIASNEEIEEFKRTNFVETTGLRKPKIESKSINFFDL